MKEIFPQAAFTKFVMPNVVFMDAKMAHKIDQPVVGLSLITLCLDQTSMYLCHVCQQSLPQDKILGHVYSPEHCVNYINYTNPNDLSFSWTPNMDMKKILRLRLQQEGDKSPLRTLQILNLPEQLLERLRTKSYSEVMQTLNENTKLTQLFENIQQKRIKIQDYQNDNNRKHPLLGMQHIVECICVGPGENRHYLCTLCCIPVATHVIINHIISFDHIHRYFKAWHPRTLCSKESYQNYNSFVPHILDFATQTVAMHKTEHVSVKQVYLQPNEFHSVNFKCYSAALKKLESLTKSSLTTRVTPGDKLVYNADAAHHIPTFKSSKCKLRCQDCNVVFEEIKPYLQHLPKDQHKRMLMKYFGQGVPENNMPRVRLHLELYTYACSSLKANQPLVGTDLVVTCVSTSVNVKPIVLCFCCLESFSEPFIGQHFESRKHLVNTLMYQNPWRLPFAWENDLSDEALKSMAWKEEEEERRQDKTCLKVLDIPYSVFFNLISLDYKQVMKILQHCNVLLKRDVPPSKTFSKLQQNAKFPLLGKQYIVSHDLSVGKNKVLTGFLCLLCERRLSQEESQAHVFSREHVATFLDRFHPGSLNPSTDNPEMLLDLAKQANTHIASNYQEIKLAHPIWEPCTYEKAKRILTGAKLRAGRGDIMTPIKPMGKLVPRNICKEEEQSQENDGWKNRLDTGRQENEHRCEVKANIQVKEEKRSDETTVKENVQIKEEKRSDETTVKENVQIKEEKRSDETTVKENVQIKEEKLSEVETQTEPFVKKEAPGSLCQDETVQPLRVKTEKDSAEVKIAEATETCKKMEKNETNKSQSIKCIQKSDVHQKNKSEQFPPERSQKRACSSEGVGQKMSPKRPRSASKDDSSLEQPVKIPKVDVKQKNNGWADVKKGDNNGLAEELSRKSTKFFTCCCVNREPVYLCGSCRQKIPRNDVFAHLTEAQHQKMDQLEVHLDEITYRSICNQSFLSVIQTLQDRGRVLSSTSPQSGCERDDASEMLQGRCGDDRAVVDMEISDSEECAATPDSSAATQTAFKASPVKVHKSANLHAGSVLKVPAAATNLSLKFSETDSDANRSPDTTVQSVRFETVLKTQDDVATGRTQSGLKLKSAKTTSPSGATVSNATRAHKPATGSAQLKSRSGSASEATAASGKAAQVRSRSLSKDDESPRCAEEMPKASIAPQTKVTPLASAKTHVEHGNRDALAKTAHRRKSVAENAESHQNKPEHKQPHKEPSLSANKAPSGNSLKVGTNQLIVVTCENKKQVYCLLCSEKLNISSQYHLTKFDHQLNYVKMKYPRMTAEELEQKSKLSHTVALLAKIEKDLPHTRMAQKLEVNKDVYEKLRTLSDKKALERVKEMLGLKDSQIPSFPVSDSLGTWKQGGFSPCEVSSSDDGILFSCDDQPEQEDRTQDQTLNQMSELDVKEEINLETYQNVDEIIYIDDDSQYESGPEPNQSPGFYTEDMKDTAQFEPDANVWCQNEVTSQIETFGLTAPDKNVPRVSEKKQPDQGNKNIHETQQFQIMEMENLKNKENSQLLEQQSSNDAQIQDQLDSDLILSHPVEKITGAKGVKTLSCAEHSLTPETQRRKSESTPQKSSPVQTCSPQLQTTASTGQQNTSELSHGVLQALNYGLGPGKHGSSQPQPRILFDKGAQGCSNLSHFLIARFGENNTEKPIVGKDLVWECQGISQKTFYLCEVCEKRLPLSEICDHMASLDHQVQFLVKKHPDMLQVFWLEDIAPERKMELLKLVNKNLAEREVANQLDAQCLLLTPEMHRFVQTASFDEALRTVKSFMKGNAGDFSRLICASQQNTVQKTEKSSLEKTVRIGDLNVVGGRRVSSLEVDPSCSKDKPVVSSAPVCKSQVPQEACRGLSPQPNVSTIQIYDPQPQEKSVSESTNSTTDAFTTCQNPSVSLSSESPPLRKRAAETPPETLLQSVTSSPLEHPLSVKRTPSPVNVQNEPEPPSASASTSVNSTESPTPQTLLDEDSDPNLTKSSVNWEAFAGLLSMLKENNFKINPTPLMAACDYAESSTSSENVENKNLKPLSKDSDKTETKAPQTLQSSSAQDVFRSARSLSAEAATNQEQDRAPRSNPEPSRSRQQTIGTIITTRTNLVKNTFQGGKSRPTHTDVSRDHQVSFHTGSTDSLPDSVSTPVGLYAPHSQVAYATKGDSGSLITQAVTGCTTLNNPNIIAASSSQEYIYPNQTYLDQTRNPFSLQMVRHSSEAQMLSGWENVGVGLGVHQLQYYHFWAN